MALRTNPAPVPSSCNECGLADICGGWDDKRRSEGCFQKCADCFSESCDYTCPANSTLFVKSVDEVRGLGTLPDRLRTVGERSADLPCYIPQIEHGGARHRLLKEPVVSIPIHRFCSISRSGRVKVTFRSREALLNSFKLSQRTQVIITCVTKDHWIEGLYEARKEILPLLRLLDPVAVTVPNFSFVRNSPRINSVWNQTKGFRLIEDMTDEELPVVPHLQAQTSRDWSRLEKLFAKFPEARHACMEFQTGLNNQDPNYPGREVYKRHFQDFQQSTGGRIHPIVLAGYREIDFLKDVCESFSLIDANVFIKTVNRQVAHCSGAERRRWGRASLSQSQDLSRLLESNISIERQFFLRNAGLGIDGKSIDPLLLPAA